MKKIFIFTLIFSFALPTVSFGAWGFGGGTSGGYGQGSTIYESNSNYGQGSNVDRTNSNTVRSIDQGFINDLNREAGEEAREIDANYKGGSYLLNQNRRTAQNMAQYSNSNIDTATCNYTFNTFKDIFNFGTCIINKALIQIAAGLAFAYFVWGVVQYVLNPNSQEERKKSRDTMIWGVIALVIIFSVWQIVKLFRVTLGL
jgi:hypothetical protein